MSRYIVKATDGRTTGCDDILDAKDAARAYGVGATVSLADGTLLSRETKWVPVTKEMTARRIAS